MSLNSPMKFLSKITLGILVFSLLVGPNVELNKLPILSLVDPVYAASALEPFADQVLTIPAGQTQASFVSELFSVDTFYAAQVAWQTNSDAHDAVHFALRTSDQDSWHSLEVDFDAADQVSLPILLSASNAVQLQVNLTDPNGVVSPTVSAIQLHLLNPGTTVTSGLQASADETVITRQQWGADESLRLRSTRDKLRADLAKKKVVVTPAPTTKPVVPSVTPKSDLPKPSESDAYGPNCSILQSKYPQEFKVTNVITTNTTGQEYTWPIAYTSKLRKIVVHHTDMEIKDYDQSGVIDAADYQAAVRSIYYFHAISRDWGDIGYNYLIDPAGHIYEGRAGGDMAIAAHTLCKNNGALGIAMLGTFQDQYPSEPALIALQSLINAKSKEYDIDLTGQGMFYGSLLQNLIGHRDARATDCPGDKLYSLLPSLRQGNLTTTTNIIYSKAASEPVVYGDIPLPPVPPALPTIAETKKVYKSAPVLTSQVVPTIPGESVTLNVQFRNQGNTIWNGDTMLRPTFLPPGITLLKQVKQSEELVSSDNLATFLPQLFIDKSIANSRANIDFYVVPNGSVDLSTSLSKVQIVVGDMPINQDISLNGVAPGNSLQNLVSKNLVAAQLKVSTSSLSNFLVQDIGGEPIEDTPIPLSLRNIRIKLSMPENHSEVSVDGDYQLVVDGIEQQSATRNQKLTIAPESQGLVVQVGATMYHGKVVRVVPKDPQGIITLLNFQHQPDWSKNLNDNQYRGAIEWRIVNSQLTTINDLPLQSYLKGLAEVSNSAPLEKQKVMAIIARSYAGYYLIKDKKFPGMPYDLDDDPNISQKYLGYGYEKRSPAFAAAVLATEGKVVTFQGEIVKTPYFNKSDGRTRSAKEVWGWDNTPYLVSVPDPLCQSQDGKLSGHGVGLSGCGAEEAARRGYSAEKILAYYYPGTLVQSL